MQPAPLSAAPQPHPSPPRPPGRRASPQVIVALVVVVVILVVGLLVAYVALTGVLNDGFVNPPTVGLDGNPVAGGEWEVQVTVDRTVGLSLYQVTLTNDTSGATCIPPTGLSSALSADCSPGVALSFVDATGPNELTSGDYFRLIGAASGETYVLRVVWAQIGAVLASETIAVPPVQPPTIALNAYPVAADAWEVAVTVDRPLALSFFSVILTNETSGSACIPETDLSATLSATCSPGVVLSFVDVAGADQLTTGDYFRLTGVGSPNQYTLRIVWKPQSAVIATEGIG